ncbi:hypothetical protein FRUB_01468 [Fimbriiglobus ruber]|uniref:Uncharacterized protein n=1 Tax=Fimbriiglobus ruber TaxID=1908690 RepID=A0A225E9N7_9BACT|nr:hypothetical protein FRUB_01468 [Fimbriiglobus ruber]
MRPANPHAVLSYEPVAQAKENRLSAFFSNSSRRHPTTLASSPEGAAENSPGREPWACPELTSSHSPFETSALGWSTPPAGRPGLTTWANLCRPFGAQNVCPRTAGNEGPSLNP